MNTAVAAPQPLVRRFMPELDALRGIAVLGVLVFHGFRAVFGELPDTGASRFVAQVAQAGVFGVNLFFVLSGFLITGILLDSRNKSDYYRRFYTRRVLRILPAYYALLVLLALMHQASAAFLGLSFIYLSNVTNLFAVSMDYHPLWSLAVEEHYYIVWPSVVRRLRPRFLAVLALAICILVPAARVIAFHYGRFQGGEWSTWYQADGLALGSLLALVLRTSITRNKATIAATSLITVATMFALAGAPFGVLSRQTMLGAGTQFTFINTFFAGLLLIFLLLGSSSRSHWVNNPTLRFFGYISYGLYLIQFLIFRLYDKGTRTLWPALVPSAEHFGLIILRFAIVAMAAIAVSYLSRKYFEEWFLRLKDRSPSETDTVPQVRTRPMGASLGTNLDPIGASDVISTAKIAARDVG